MNRREARAQLQLHLSMRRHFGQYRDAMHSQEWRLFTAMYRLPSICKMLHPLEIDTASAAGPGFEGRVEIAAAEVIRQILGWRAICCAACIGRKCHQPGKIIQHQLDLQNGFGMAEPAVAWRWRYSNRCNVPTPTLSSA